LTLDLRIGGIFCGSGGKRKPRWIKPGLLFRIDRDERFEYSTLI
jgi:hypothetical protein